MSAEPVTRLHAPPAQPEFRREGLGFVWEPLGGRVRFRARHIKRTGGELWAEVEVRSFFPGGREFLVRARYNLSVDSARTRLAGYLSKQYDAPTEVEWPRLVELFCVRVLEAQHEGEGVVLLGRLPEPEYQPDLVEKIIQAGQITSLYGPQGEGKGWLAVALAVCVQAGLSFCGLRVRRARVLYLDWEADRWTFQRRARAVCAGFGIEPLEIAWYKPRGPIGQDVDYIAEYVQREGVGLLIWDSIGQAGGSPSEHGGGYEGIALGIFEAASLMGDAVSHLWIDHLNAEGIKEKIAGKAHGAVRKMAQARVAWEVRKVQEEEADAYSVGLFHTKFNNTRKYAPLGFRLSFESDDYGRATVVGFEREDVRGTDNAERLSLPARFEVELHRARRALTTKELSERLSVSQASVRTIGGRLESRGRVVRLGDGGRNGQTQLWGLREGAQHATPPHTPPVALRPPATLQQGNTQQGATVAPLPAADGGRLPYAEPEDSADFDEEVF